jgi:hypothetical protein
MEELSIALIGGGNTRENAVLYPELPPSHEAIVQVEGGP